MEIEDSRARKEISDSILTFMIGEVGAGETDEMI